MKENQAKVDQFIQEHKASINFVKSKPDVASEVFNKKFSETGITLNERSIVNLNLTFLEGDEMKDKLEAFLDKIYKYNPKLIGNELPDDDFYYKAGQNLEEDEEDNG